MAQAYGSSFDQPPINSSEDCLYLDVWVPEWPVKRAFPVMVWLHGGSNTVGSGSQSAYQGDSLTRHGVLLVIVFGTFRDREWRWLPSTASDVALSALLQTYWTNFAKAGDPNSSGLPDWPAWSDEEMKFLVVNKDASVTTQRNFSPLFSRLGADELKQSFKRQ